MDDWIQDKEVITETYLEIINAINYHFLFIVKENFDRLKMVFPLAEFIMERFETVITLCINGLLWDCEIILRSTQETFVKYLYMLDGEQPDVDIKIDEYWKSLAEIQSLKMSSQAKLNLELLDDNDFSKIAFLPLVLSEEEEKRLKLKWPKKERSKLEQKWSFSQMVLELSANKNNIMRDYIMLLTFNYRMGSHIIHGDETGIGIINERRNREAEENLKAEQGHYLRILSDVLSYNTLLSVQTMAFLKLEKESDNITEYQRKIHEIDNLISKYEGRVFEDSDYNQYRK
ncbi:MAG: hypothetical protein I8H68_05860 [Flavobacteriia bacterium]|nr:hypothetical protein [Flavobacteriia bacterium]